MVILIRARHVIPAIRMEMIDIKINFPMRCIKHESSRIFAPAGRVLKMGKKIPPYFWSYDTTKGGGKWSPKKNFHAS